jgi:hypothetical protein
VREQRLPSLDGANEFRVNDMASTLWTVGEKKKCLFSIQSIEKLHGTPEW